MRRLLKIILTLSLTTCLLTHAVAQKIESEPIGTIEVSGRGEIMVEPNEFNLSILLDVRSTKQSWSVAEADMFRALSAIGIERKELRMEDLSSATERRRSTKTSARYQLTLHSTALVNECFEALGQVSGTQVEITSVTNSEMEGYQSEARKLAVKDASSKAEELAAELSLSVGYCTLIREHANYNNYYQQPIMMRSSGNGIASAEESKPLEFTKIKVQCSVDATFQSHQK